MISFNMPQVCFTNICVLLDHPSEQQESIIHSLQNQYDKVLKEKEDLLAKLNLKEKEHPQYSATSFLFPEKPEERPFAREVFSQDLPPSSVYCSSTERDKRLVVLFGLNCSLKFEFRQCHIKNLYYHPQVDQFFVVKGNRTIYMNVPESRNDVLVDMSSLSDHGIFTMNFSEVPEHLLKSKTLSLVEDRTYLMMRFHTGNIMHCMHDDVLGIYFHLKMNAPPVKLAPGAEYNSEEYSPFSKNHNLMFVDGFDEGGYGHIFKYMSNYPLRFKGDMPKDKIAVLMVCI